LQKVPFYPGGGRHISIAASGKLVFSTWFDSEGENAGRVDVTSLDGADAGQICSTFTLTGNRLHGAGVAGGKVFFGASDGVAWVNAGDRQSWIDNKPVVGRIDLGTDAGVPRRARYFAALGDHVAFVTGQAYSSSLILVDASGAEPTYCERSLEVPEGKQAKTPVLVHPPKSSPQAWVLLGDSRRDASGKDHEIAADEPSAAIIIELDPDGDGVWCDAKVKKSYPLGKPKLVDHEGNHAIAFDASGMYALLTNPGDSELVVISTSSLTSVASFKVPGTPTRIQCVGANGKSK